MDIMVNKLYIPGKNVNFEPGMLKIYLNFLKA